MVQAIVSTPRWSSDGPSTSSIPCSRFCSFEKRRSRHSQKTRRAVHDDDPRAAVEDSQLETVEQDSGSTRVVHQDVIFFQIGGQIVDDRIEVAVPAVPIHLVVREAETFNRLMSPILVRYSIKAAGPYERHALIRRRYYWPRDRRVQLQQFRDNPLRLPTPSAYRGCAEPVDERTGHPGAPESSLESVGQINHSKIKLGLRTKRQAAER